MKKLVGLIKTKSLYKVSYFPQPYIHSKSKIKAELESSNYATKSDLKSATCVGTWCCVKKVDLANLRYWKTTPVDSSKLSNAVKSDVVKKTMWWIV